MIGKSLQSGPRARPAISRPIRSCMQLSLPAVLLWSILPLVPAPPAGRPPPTTTPRPPVPGFEVHLAGTYALREDGSGTAMHAYRGLVLFMEYINVGGYFKTWGGNDITLRLTVENDESTSDVVVSKYKKFASWSNVTALFGPYGSSMSAPAAEEAHNAGKFIMLSNAANNAIYQKGHPYVFSTNVMGSDYFANGLALLREQGASSAVMVSRFDGFSQTACAGAVGHAVALGYKVLGNLVIETVSVLQSLREIMAQKPDVFVGCGRLDTAIALTTTARALNFNPNAYFMSQGSTTPFVQAVSAPNAHSFIGPEPWDASVTFACPVFGSAENFYNLYVARWNITPTYHAAGAAAGAYALMRGIEAIDAPPPFTSQQIRESLLKLNATSFYGILEFFPENGTRKGAIMVAQQLFPKPSTASKLQRYTELDVTRVDENSPPVFPIKSWKLRHLELYPCETGYTRNTSSPDLTACRPCPAGFHRDAVSLECVVCGVDSYGDREGQSECNVCSESMNCSSEENIGIPLAAAGWYRLDTSATSASFYECIPPRLCIGANQCTQNHQGFLCSRCVAGYGSFMNNAKKANGCHRCNNSALQGGLLAAIIVGYCLYIGIVARLTNKAVPALSEVNVIIVRILIKQGQLLSATLLITEFAQWRTGGMPFENVGPPSAMWLALEFFMNPFLAWISLDCWVEDPAQAYRTSVLLGLFILPGALLVVAALTLLAIGLASLLRLVSPPQTSSEVPKAFNAMERRTGFLRRASNEETPEMNFEHLQTKDVTTAARSNLEKRLQEFKNDVWIVPDEMPDDYRDNSLSLAKIAMHGVQLACIVVFIFQPMSLELLLVGCTCQLVDKPRLRANLDIVCFDGDHTIWYALSQTAFQIYGIGVPVLIFLLLRWKKDSFMKINCRRQFGFFFFGLEESRAFYYECLCMLRLNFFLLTTELQDGFTRITIALPMSFLFLWLHLRAEPYDRRSFHMFSRLDVLGLVAVSMSLTGRLLFEMAEVLDDNGIRSRFLHDNSLRWGYVTICVLTFALLLPLAGLGMLRTSITLPLYFDHECFKWPVNGLIKLAFLLDEQHQGYMTLTPLIHEMDITKLSPVEKNFMSEAIHDTIGAYISSPKGRFKLLWTLAAFRIAYERCQRARFHRARKLLCQRLYPDAELPSVFQDSDQRQSRNIRSTRRTTGEAAVMALWRQRIGEPRQLTDHEATELFEKAGHVAHMGVHVEDWYMALMISWRSIVAGHDEYFKIHPAEDPRDVLFDHKATWDDDTSMEDFFQQLAWRQGLRQLPLATPESYRAVEAAKADFDLLALEHAEPLKPLLNDSDLNKLQQLDELEEHVMDLQAQAEQLRTKLSYLDRQLGGMPAVEVAELVQASAAEAINVTPSVDDRALTNREDLTPLPLSRGASATCESWSPSGDWRHGLWAALPLEQIRERRMQIEEEMQQQEDLATEAVASSVDRPGPASHMGRLSQAEARAVEKALALQASLEEDEEQEEEEVLNGHEEPGQASNTVISDLEQAVPIVVGGRAPKRKPQPARPAGIGPVEDSEPPHSLEAMEAAPPQVLAADAEPKIASQAQSVDTFTSITPNENSSMITSALTSAPAHDFESSAGESSGDDMWTV